MQVIRATEDFAAELTQERLAAHAVHFRHVPLQGAWLLPDRRAVLTRVSPHDAVNSFHVQCQDSPNPEALCADAAREQFDGADGVMKLA